MRRSSWRSMTGIKLGDVAHVAYRNFTSPAIVADVDPRGKIGEGFIALARAFGLDPSPRHRGTGVGVECVVFRGSTRGWPRTLEDIAAQVAALLDPATGVGFA